MASSRNSLTTVALAVGLALAAPVNGQVRIKTATLTAGAFSAGPGMLVGMNSGQTFVGLATDGINASGTGFWYTILDELTVVSNSVERLGEEIPVEYELNQNYPNPFNPTTKIKYGLPSSARVRVSVFNVLGQLVTTIIDREQAAGYYEVMWDATADNGMSLPSGLYFYRIDTKDFSATRSMVLQK